MLKENWRLISRIERAGDLVIVILAFFIAYYGRDSLLYWNEYFDWSIPFGGPALAPIKDYALVLGAGILSYMMFLNFFGAYSSMRLSSSWRLLRVSVLSSLGVFMSLAAVLFLLKIDLSRSFIALFCILVALSLAAERYIVLAVLRYFRRRGWNYRNVIVCGVGEQAVRFAETLSTRPELGIRIRTFASLKPRGELSRELVEQFKNDLRAVGCRQIGKILYGVPEVERALKEYAIDEVVFTDVVDVMPQIEEMILVASEQGVRTTLAADLFSIGMVKSGLSYFGDMPLIHFQTPPGDRWELGAKRLVDIVLSAFFLLALSPLLLLIAVLVKLSSKGPVIYTQRRIGLNGRFFDMYKFRSMYSGADAQLPKLASKNEMSGPVFKMKDDPRVTAVGKVLRKYSLDELPQLWNVLIGDMSLVGPRPPVPGEVNLYQRRDRRRLSMRPGITCIWQVSGRNKIQNFEDWVALDLEYIDNWSLARDFALLFRTIPAVLLGTGR